jgi:hypothetical protein
MQRKVKILENDEHTLALHSFPSMHYNKFAEVLSIINKRFEKLNNSVIIHSKDLNLEIITHAMIRIIFCRQSISKSRSPE